MSTYLEFAFPAALVCFYVVTYLKVRSQSENTPVVVQYEPAEGLSPAAARYVWKGCVDQRTVASVFTQLAVKGYVRIEPDGGSYHITRTKPSGPVPAMTKEEQIAVDWLFSNFLTEVHFKPTHDSEGCISALTGSLQKQTGALYHATHYGYVSLGLLFSLIGAFVTAATIDVSDRAGLYFLTWIAFMTAILAVITVWATLISAVVDLARSIGDFGRATFGVLLSAFVLTAVYFVGVKLEKLASPEFVFSVMLMATLNLIAGAFLKSTTPRGREVKRQLEGFREFLKTAEQDRLDRLNQPRVTLQSQERNLAYAIALEVKEAWGDELTNACYPQLA